MTGAVYGILDRVLTYQGDSPAEQESLRRYRSLFFLGVLFYPLWWWLYREAMPHAVDPFWARLSTYLVMVVPGVLSFASRTIRYYIPLFNSLVGWVVTLHSFALVYANNIDGPYTLAYFVITVGAGFSILSLKELISYFAFNILLSGFLLFLPGQIPKPLYFACLLTCFSVLYISFTSRAKAYQVLNMGQRYLKTMFLALDDLIYLVRPDLSLIAFNGPKAALGEGLAALPDTNILCLWSGDMREYFRQAHDEVIRTGETFHKELLLPTSEGAKWFMVRLSSLNNAGGEIGGILGIFRNVHEQRMTQSQLRRSKNFLNDILQSIQDLLIVVDSADRIIDLNSKAADIIGLQRKNLIGRSILSYISFSEGPYHDLGKRRLVEFVRKNPGLEMRMNLKAENSEDVPVSLTLNLMADINGRAFGVVILAKDERQSVLAQKLQEAQVQLVQSAKLASLGEMSSGIAHEINQPLFLISGFAGRIRNVLDKRQHIEAKDLVEYLKEIESNVERMNQIIRHLREFSHSSGLKTEAIEVNEVIKNSLILMSEQLRLRSIEVVLDLDEDNPRVCGDAIRLEQVFVNLLTNSRDALKDMQYGRVQIRTRSECQRVTIRFADNGPGIPESLVGKVFDPFFTTKEVGVGTGLGLSISHSIIKDHHGSIELQSRQDGGRGVQFIIGLPLAKSQPKQKIEAS